MNLEVRMPRFVYASAISTENKVQSPSMRRPGEFSLSTWRGPMWKAADWRNRFMDGPSSKPKAVIFSLYTKKIFKKQKINEIKFCRSHPYTKSEDRNFANRPTFTDKLHASLGQERRATYQFEKQCWKATRRAFSPPSWWICIFPRGTRRQHSSRTRTLEQSVNRKNPFIKDTVYILCMERWMGTTPAPPPHNPPLHCA